jgi:hypothetical protein
MTVSDPTNDSLDSELIAEELGIGAIDAQRAKQVILDAYLDPDNSVLSLNVGAILSEVANQHGYRRIWEVLHMGLLIEVGERWDRRRRLLDIKPHPAH